MIVTYFTYLVIVIGGLEIGIKGYRAIKKTK